MVKSLSKNPNVSWACITEIYSGLEPGTYLAHQRIAGIGGDLWRVYSPTSLLKAEQVGSVSSHVLNKCEGSIASLGCLFQCLTIFIVKKKNLSLVFIWNLHFNLCPCAFWPITKKSLILSFPLASPHSAIYTHWSSLPWAFSLLNNPKSLSLSNIRCFSPFIISMAFHYPCSGVSMSLLYCGAQILTQQSRWVSPELSREEGSHPSTCQPCSS